MEIKNKQQRIFPYLCGLLIFIACCFRTGAVLRAEKDVPSPTETELYFYLSSQESQEAELPGEETPVPGSVAVEIDNRSGTEVSVDTLLQRDTPFRIADSPCVLILHTHGSEAYRDQEDYRSTDPEENVIRVGREIADVLNAAGISTVHDTVAHDVTEGYDLAYDRAAESIAAWLDKYPTIQMVIDVHRDASSDGQGGQKPVSAQIAGEEAAGLMLVMGTDTPELPHKNWQENLAFAVKLQSCLEENAPGLMRAITLRKGRYNQHFTSCSILLEVGSAGNTMEEALCSARYFGESLARLLKAENAN